MLAEGLMLTLAYDSFTIADEGHAESLPDWPLLEPGTRITINAPGILALPDSDWALETDAAPLTHAFQENLDPWTAYLDADACSGPLTLRTRLPGDRIAPQGMGGHMMKLNELMINTKTPRATRDRMPLLVCGERIVWACGLRIEEYVCVTSATHHILHLRFVRLVG